MDRIPLGPCTCPDFAPNVKILNAPLMLEYARNPDTCRGYTGKEFKFCPWCGTALRLFVDPAELPANQGVNNGTG